MKKNDVTQQTSLLSVASTESRPRPNEHDVERFMPNAHRTKTNSQPIPNNPYTIPWIKGNEHVTLHQPPFPINTHPHLISPGSQQQRFTSLQFRPKPFDIEMLREAHFGSRQPPRISLLPPLQSCN
ncbi:hypothetical protein AVEN_89757-1 [Araneus ventricosus]|uniref:Uncharacterized protein n=1 Tax=Araneus ventricosus TaxID=182803 RepID=A0A4Y2IVC9_ARAVE|nr:hypothetical protein AVEN_89757-1 [Araneus ventricosus]